MARCRLAGDSGDRATHCNEIRRAAESKRVARCTASRRARGSRRLAAARCSSARTLLRRGGTDRYARRSCPRCKQSPVCDEPGLRRPISGGGRAAPSDSKLLSAVLRTSRRSRCAARASRLATCCSQWKQPGCRAPNCMPAHGASGYAIRQATDRQAMIGWRPAAGGWRVLKYSPPGIRSRATRSRRLPDHFPHEMSTVVSSRRPPVSSRATRKRRASAIVRAVIASRHH